jgi:isocitrate/isopropylmalate dehydrogenase
MLLSAIEMLKYIGENDAANRIRTALLSTLEAGCKTMDIGGECTCSSFADEIISRL